MLNKTIKEVLKTNHAIDLEEDVQVFNSIKDLMKKHNLEEGDKLPSERKLSEKLGVSRNQIRSAVQKLEFYGIIKTLPQSGSVITGIGVPAINNMMKDVLELDAPDFKSLVETRIIIENAAVRLAAQRRTARQLEEIENAQLDFTKKILNNEPALIEDIKFHLTISKASGNKVLHGIMKLIAPDIIAHFNKEQVCDRTKAEKLINEHNDVLNAIRNQNVPDAAESLDTHFTSLKNYLHNNN